MPTHHGDNYVDFRPLTMRQDDTGTYTYVGEAEPGGGTDKGVWRVMRITNASGLLEWAKDGRFENIWDNRASLSYA